MVSLRGRGLTLLALRGRFRVKGEVCTEVVLEPGVDIELYDNLWLHCDEVILPDTLQGLRMEGLPDTVLTHTTSVFMSPIARVQPGYHPDADVTFWTLGEAWSYRTGEHPPQSVRIGEHIDVSGGRIEVIALPFVDASHARTRQTRREPLHLHVTPGKGVRIARRGRATSLSGIPGKIFATLATHQAPRQWEEVAAEVWSDEHMLKSSLRRRFDVGLMRLRDKMRRADLPTNLISMDGFGMVRLELEAHDEIAVAEE